MRRLIEKVESKLEKVFIKSKLEKVNKKLKTVPNAFLSFIHFIFSSIFSNLNNFLAMSSSEVPSTCADNTSYENSLTVCPSLTRSKSQLLNQPQNATRKRRAINVTRINLANMAGQQRASGAQGLTGVFGSQDSLNSANGISDDDSNCDSPLDDANEKRLRLNSQSSSQYSSDDGYEQIAELECSQGSAVSFYKSIIINHIYLF